MSARGDRRPRRRRGEGENILMHRLLHHDRDGVRTWRVRGAKIPAVRNTDVCLEIDPVAAAHHCPDCRLGSVRLRAAVADHHHRVVSALRSHIERYDASLREIVDQSATPAAALRNVFMGAANDCGFIVRTAVELAAHDDEIGRIVTDVWCEVETLFGTLIEEGQGAGEIAEHVDPASTARALLGMCLGSRVIGEPLLLQAQTLVPAPA